MKKKLFAFSIIVALLISSFGSSFAASRLSRPVIEEVEAGKKSIKIDWNYVQHADEYDIFRSTSPKGEYKYICTSEESWYRDYEVKKGTRYYYKVRAISYDEYEDSKLSKWRSGKINKPATKTTSYSSVSTSVAFSPTVYITNTGSKYHRAGCRYLHSSSRAITLNEARNYGYTACSVCWY